MDCSKESLLDDDDKEQETDRSSESNIYRLIREMAQLSGKKKKPARRSKRFGKGPGGERDYDMDYEDDSSDDGIEGELSVVEIRSRVLGAGYTEVQLNSTIMQYEDINIWTRVANGTKLRFIDNIGSP